MAFLSFRRHFVRSFGAIYDSISLGPPRLHGAALGPPMDLSNQTPYFLTIHSNNPMNWSNQTPYFHSNNPMNWSNPYHPNETLKAGSWRSLPE